MKKTHIIYLLIIALLLCGSTALFLYMPRGDAERPAEETAAHRSDKFENRVENALSPSTAGAPPVSVREEIRRRRQENAERLTTSAAVDAYLEELKAHARANGVVTALEVQPGVEALESLTEQLGDQETIRRSEAFLNEMALLSRELHGETNAPVPAPDLDRLLNAVEQATDSSARQTAIRAYLSAAEQLPEESQEAALNRLRPFSPFQKQEDIATTE